MKILEVQARSVVVIFEETIEGLEKIKSALDCAVLKSSTDEEKEAISYLTMVVYPFILQTLEGIKGKEEK